MGDGGSLLNYTVYHCHSDLSVFKVDSVTKYKDYIKRAKECGMTALGFSEHGNTFAWEAKKTDIEAVGMKYIFAIEVYLTATLEEKIRDNYHTVLIARNYDGVQEINRMVTKSFERDGHYYYDPRITFDELFTTSKNIIVTTACLASPLHKGTGNIVERYLDWIVANKDRCFFEIQHHMDPEQVKYNDLLYKLGQEYGVRLIAGTDTHALNEEHANARVIMQRAKNVHFDGEDNFDLVFKTYDELVEAYRKQNALPESVFLEAINNTNIMADMVEPFEINHDPKYPHIYDDSEATFKQKINEGYKECEFIRKKHRLAELKPIINDEFEVYKTCKSIDFMLLERHMVEWERQNGILRGYGRGSCTGSLISALLGITYMDPIDNQLNFFRFMNPSRVTNCDIDCDYEDSARAKVKTYLLRDHMELPNIHTSEIITFNSLQMKGAIKDVGRALGMSLELTQSLSDAVSLDENKKQVISDEYRKQYPELFRYVDIITGVYVSIGTHPSGVLVSDHDIESEIGLCRISGSDYPVSMLDMKSLDRMMYVKLDILGLDTIGVINETCRLAGIPRINPSDLDYNDMKVWDSIRKDTTLIFQFESDSAQAYVRDFLSKETIDKVKALNPNFSMLKWFSFGSAALRPACESFRDEVAKGETYDNGLPELNKFLAKTLGRLALQEDIMRFLTLFCGYSDAESDNVRRAIAKKKGTATLLPEIEERFINYTSEHYNTTKEKCSEVIKPFLQVIQDASAYGFSWNHSDAYAATGYAAAYLRYYYPLEFLTAALDTFADDKTKTANIIAYANRHKITVEPIKFRFSQSKYSFNKEKNIIYKGIGAIKYLSTIVADELYKLKDIETKYFSDVLVEIGKSPIDTRQTEILIRLGFFGEFGNVSKLLRVNDCFNLLWSKAGKKMKALLAIEDYLAKLKITDETMMKFAKKKTEKSYSGVDAIGLLHYIEDHTKNLKDDIRQNVKDEYEYLGYAHSFDKIYEGIYYVTEAEVRWGNTYIKRYNLATGVEDEARIKGQRLSTKEPKFIIVKSEEVKPRNKKMVDENGNPVLDDKGRQKWIPIPGTKVRWIKSFSVADD